MGSIRESIIEDELERGMFEDLSDSEHELVGEKSPLRIQRAGVSKFVF